MKFVNRNDRCRRVDDADDLVERVVNDAPDFYSGEIEALRAKVDALIGIVGRLVKQINDPAKVVEVAGAYGWEVDE